MPLIVIVFWAAARRRPAGVDCRPALAESAKEASALALAQRGPVRRLLLGRPDARACFSALLVASTQTNRRHGRPAQMHT